MSCSRGRRKEKINNKHLGERENYITEKYNIFLKIQRRKI